MAYPQCAIVLIVNVLPLPLLVRLTVVLPVTAACVTEAVLLLPVRLTTAVLMLPVCATDEDGRALYDIDSGQSVPLLAYRLLMLAWALWLARALLGWIRWGWAAFTSVRGWWPPAISPDCPTS